MYFMEFLCGVILSLDQYVIDVNGLIYNKRK